MIVIAVGERIHNPKLSARAEARLAADWKPMLSPALRVVSSTRTRWLAVGGDRVSYMFNLLPPCATSGAWNAALATKHAEEMLSYAADQHMQYGAPENARLVLLGRKVERAFTDAPRQWGTVYVVDGIDCTTLPHPSGRCRVWNDTQAHARLRRALIEFCAEVKR